MGMKFPQNGDAYAIYCKSTGRCFIGVTSDVAGRVAYHFSQLRNRQKDVFDKVTRKAEPSVWQQDYDKYGEGDFAVYVLERNIPPGNRQERERYWMNEYNSTDPFHGYNSKPNYKKAVKEIPVIDGLPPKAKGQRK